tara:strand:- start:598 stop:1302 length:705 start_codon:yes stop_codon:yes gene_type:complete
MAKIYGSETSSMVVDHCLQIFGGYGFIEEYPMAMPYRDDRINQIWEGTNEINRAIITGYMMKKVLMEEISLRDYLKNLNNFLGTAAEENNKDPFSKEKHALESAKMLTALIFQEALCSFGQDLKHEQQLSETLADMFTHLFTAESLIARVQQVISPKRNSGMAMNIAKIDVAESLLDIILMSGKCLNRIFEENTPKDILNTVKKLSSKMTLNTDTIKLKKLLGEYMFEQKKYPF